MEQSSSTPPASAAKTDTSVKTALQLLLPMVLLAAVILVFIRTNGAGLNVTPAAPVEALQFDRTILKPGQIELKVTNTSPQEIKISQIVVNDSFWMFTAAPSPTIPRLGQATITLAYPWVAGEMYNLSLLTSNSIAFAHVIDVASATKTTDNRSLLSFTLIGLYVGLIPVLLGMLWLPVLRRMSRVWSAFFTALTIGLLIFLGIDATNEALEQARDLGGAFQGVGIVGIGIVGTFMLLHAVSRRQERLGGEGPARRKARGPTQNRA